ncbi:MAG: hypothetical protein ACO1Q7_09675 [Gemmatimonas sp.]
MHQKPPKTPTRQSDERSGPNGPKADRRALRGRLVVRQGSRASDRLTPRTMLAAVVVHVLVIAVLVRMVTLGHGLHDWFGLAPTNDILQERVTYVEPKSEPKPPEPKPEPKPVAEVPKVTSTEPVTAPVTSAPPSGVAVDPALVAGARGGGGDSTGAGGGKPRNLGINPALIGLAPALSDPRVWEPGALGINLPRTQGQMLDSVLGWAIASAADSLDSIARLYDPNRKPAEWVKRMKNGEKWGWDKTGLRLGKFTVPNALLALLPASAQRGMQSNPIEAARDRRILLAREDIDRFQAYSMGEADFRKALKEIRQRKDREYEQRARARAAENNNPPPKTPPKSSNDR